MSRQSWSKKFAVAIAGVTWSIRTQNSFRVHLPIAIAVLTMAAWLRTEAWRLVAIIFAITIVMTAEMLNTAIEQLVKAVHPQHDQRIGHALDVAAGAVLVATIGAIAIGLITLGLPLWEACTAILSAR